MPKLQSIHDLINIFLLLLYFYLDVEHILYFLLSVYSLWLTSTKFRRLVRNTAAHSGPKLQPWPHSARETNYLVFQSPRSARKGPII